MNQWNIRDVVSKGDYLYAIIPEHPNKTSNHYVLLHRAIMENNLGRLLLSTEIVHHINDNKKDNRLENLQLMFSTEHNRIHQINKGEKWVDMICPQCGKIFSIPKNKTHIIKKTGDSTCCSKSCGGKLAVDKKLNRVSDVVKNRIKNSLIGEYIKYKSTGKFEEYTHHIDGREVIKISNYTINNPETENYEKSRGCKIRQNKTRQKKQRVIKFNIDKEYLKELVWEMPTSKIAELYGVSDNAISKRCKKWNIVKPSRGYWEKKYHNKI